MRDIAGPSTGIIPRHIRVVLRAGGILDARSGSGRGGGARRGRGANFLGGLGPGTAVAVDAWIYLIGEVGAVHVCSGRSGFGIGLQRSGGDGRRDRGGFSTEEVAKTGGWVVMPAASIIYC